MILLSVSVLFLLCFVVLFFALCLAPTLSMCSKTVLPMTVKKARLKEDAREKPTCGANIRYRNNPEKHSCVLREFGCLAGLMP